mmetsp:Transcript_4046/g.6831  ORF Transcript_4046/g.6831 Transcript_4046/m.6831 type:complete len:290 (-) Transcript_4046:26-895(-)
MGIDQYLGSHVHWADVTEEQSSVYIIRLTIAFSVLFLLLSERIHLDPPDLPYRKSIMVCLLVITTLVVVAFIAYATGKHHYIHLFAYKLSEGMWVLVNCTVAHFPSRLLAEPPEKLHYFFYFSLLLVAGAVVCQGLTHRSYNAVYVANLAVSGYSLRLLLRLVALLQQQGLCVKAAECLCRVEYIIVFINSTIIVLTVLAGTKAYHLKGSLFVMYWFRIHFLLVEYGRRFVVQLSPEEAAANTSGELADNDIRGLKAMRSFLLDGSEHATEPPDGRGSHKLDPNHACFS